MCRNTVIPSLKYYLFDMLWYEFVPVVTHCAAWGNAARNTAISRVWMGGVAGAAVEWILKMSDTSLENHWDAWMLVKFSLASPTSHSCAHCSFTHLPTHFFACSFACWNSEYQQILCLCSVILILPCNDAFSSAFKIELTDHRTMIWICLRLMQVDLILLVDCLSH